MLASEELSTSVHQREEVGHCRYLQVANFFAKCNNEAVLAPICTVVPDPSLINQEDLDTDSNVVSNSRNKIHRLDPQPFGLGLKWAIPSL